MHPVISREVVLGFLRGTQIQTTFNLKKLQVSFIEKFECSKPQGINWFTFGQQTCNLLDVQLFHG